jgi:RNA polymerase sigma-70 factor (sigma-E family)
VAGADDEEFREFMHSRWPGLVRLGYSLTGEWAAAEDLAQTALAKAYASWSRVRRADDPDAYVRRILVNANHSRFRRRRVAEHSVEAPPEVGIEDQSGTVDERSWLVAALRQLPPKQRSVVILRYCEDLSETQVAAVLGCSVGNVKSQASRALARLRASDELAEGSMR